MLDSINESYHHYFNKIINDKEVIENIIHLLK